MQTLLEIKDVKIRRIYAISIVEELFTKRPYNKILALNLLNLSSDIRRSDWFDHAKLARECLKSLTAEELR